MFVHRVADRFRSRQAGISLIELVIFIVIVSIGIAGILVVMNVTTRHSADPMVRKQALAIAESLMEEIELQPFTFCDPDDPQASTATSATVGTNGCSSAAYVQGLTPTTVNSTTETRYADPRFDNVGDYGGFKMTGIRDITNNPITGLENYAATVALSNPTNLGISPADVIQITVTVAGPGGTVVTLDGYRFRYAPNATP